MDYWRGLYDFFRPCARGRRLVRGHVRLCNSGRNIGPGWYISPGVHAANLARAKYAAFTLGGWVFWRRSDRFVLSSASSAARIACPPPGGRPQRDTRRLNRSLFRQYRRVGLGNFALSPSQIPDLNLSIHPARVTARRLPPSVVYRAPPAVGYPTSVDPIQRR